MEKTTFLKHPMVTAIIGTLVGTLIGSLIAASVTATNVEKATVELMSKRLEIVEENDTLEEAIKKVNKDVEKKDAVINEQSKQIAELTKQVNDDTEIKNLNGELQAKQTEIDTLQDNMSSLQKEKDKLQEDKDKLQADFDELKEKKYDEYMRDRQTSTPISLGNIEVLKNVGVDNDNTGDVSVDGTTFADYIATGNKGEAYIEYKIDGKYSEFKGSAYISKWAYTEYDSNDSRIRNASISIEVKYPNSDSYQVIDSVSGLSADGSPATIGGSLIGATRLRIVFRGGGSSSTYNYQIIRLGDPVLYETVS